MQDSDAPSARRMRGQTTREGRRPPPEDSRNNGTMKSQDGSPPRSLEQTVRTDEHTGRERAATHKKFMRFCEDHVINSLSETAKKEENPHNIIKQWFLRSWASGMKGWSLKQPGESSPRGELRWSACDRARRPGTHVAEALRRAWREGLLGIPEQGPGLCEDAAGSWRVWVLIQVPEMTGAQWPNWERAQFTGSQVEYSGRHCLGGQK